MILNFNKTKILVTIVSFLFLCFSPILSSQNIGKKWLLAKMLHENLKDITISGNPEIVGSPYGDAVSFNGTDDAFFLKEMPLKLLKEFTIEMIFNPSIDGDFEQRVLHMGEISEDRMLLEIRAVEGNWYFDGFVASGENKLALIDEKRIHPLGQWYHVAFVVAKDRLSTYVNGKLELTEPFSFNPIQTGQSSVGVRLNKRSWFKGVIYKIKVTPKKLKPKRFITL